MVPDTHAHLDASVFSADLDEVIARAQEAGVDRILAVGSDLESSRRALAIAHKYDPVYAAIGIHPHEAWRFRDEAKAIEELLREEKVVAVGEVGLDYHRDLSPRDEQMVTFREQVRWSVELGLPLSVHNRSADDDILEVLSSGGATAVLHCFSSSSEFAAAALQYDVYVSFAGNLTYPKASALREVAREIPLERLLVETDAPVLAPQTWRGRRNEPAHVSATLEVLSAVRDLPSEVMARRISENADMIFHWRDS
jgi:TatD DNase family protein